MIYPDFSNSQFDVKYSKRLLLLSDVVNSHPVISDADFGDIPPVVIDNPEDSSETIRFGVAGEDDIASQDRIFNLQSNMFYLHGETMNDYIALYGDGQFEGYTEHAATGQYVDFVMFRGTGLENGSFQISAHGDTTFSALRLNQNGIFQIDGVVSLQNYLSGDTSPVQSGTKHMLTVDSAGVMGHEAIPSGGGGGGEDLEDTMILGNTTTQPLYSTSLIQSSSVFVLIGTDLSSKVILDNIGDNGSVYIANSLTYGGTIKADNLVHNVTYQLPDSINATETLAVVSQLPVLTLQSYDSGNFTTSSTANEDLITYNIPANTLINNGDAIEIYFEYTTTGGASANIVNIKIDSNSYNQHTETATMTGIIRLLLVRTASDSYRISGSCVKNYAFGTSPITNTYSEVGGGVNYAAIIAIKFNATSPNGAGQVTTRLGRITKFAR